MPLWGATDSDESKPKNLTTAEKKQVFANAVVGCSKLVLLLVETIIQVQHQKFL